MNNVVELLQTLIRIPSVNPDGDPGVNLGGEAQMAEFLAEFLTPLGFSVNLEEVLPGRPNLIATAPGSHDRPRILLGPHLDTVGVGGMTIDPWSGEIRNEKIWGRGASDTKGPMAAMLMGLKANAHKLAELPVAVDFIGFMGEESNQPGSKHFGKHHGADYQFAIAGEPTSMEAVYCTKGSLWATLEAKGKSVHASKPHLGENAILKMSTALSNLVANLDEHLKKFTHPVLGQSTVNVGMIEGGTRPNIVPDRCRAVIDIRTVPALVEKQNARNTLADFLADLPIELISADENPPMEMSHDHPWLNSLNLPITGAPWFSDAAHLSDAGIPSICLGPGSIDQAHTKDEFIKISDLEEGVQWFDQFISNLKPLSGT